MSTTTMPAVSAPAPSVMDRCVAISISLSAIGNRRKVKDSAIKETRQQSLIEDMDDTAAVLVKADKEWVSASKKLLDSPELKAITTLDGEIRQFINKLCLPSMFRSGIYLIPLELIDRVERELKAFQNNRQSLVDAFVAVYQDKVREAKGRLRDLFSDADYKSVGEVMASFGFEWSYVSLGTPERLQGVRRDLYLAEKEKAAKRWQEATDEIKLLLRATMKEFTDHLVDRLTPTDDGSRKRFRASAIENFSEFLGNFDLRNVTDDTELQQLVDRARGLLGGVQDVESLRTDEGLRSQIRQGFERIQQELAPLVEDVGSRAISFDEV